MTGEIDIDTFLWFLRVSGAVWFSIEPTSTRLEDERSRVNYSSVANTSSFIMSFVWRGKRVKQKEKKEKKEKIEKPCNNGGGGVVIKSAMRFVINYVQDVYAYLN